MNINKLNESLKEMRDTLEGEDFDRYIVKRALANAIELRNQLREIAGSGTHGKAMSFYKKDLKELDRHVANMADLYRGWSGR